jgi:hypothetical protein
MWSGTFGGDAFGTWTADFQHVGTSLTGTATIDSVPTSVQGTIVCDRILVGFVEFATFDGTLFENQGQTCASGTWEAPGGGAGGTWEGCK